MQSSIDIQDPEQEHDTTTETDLERQQLEMHLRDSVIGRYIRNYNRTLADSQPRIGANSPAD